jgi:hypothetical protein
MAGGRPDDFEVIIDFRYRPVSETLVFALSPVRAFESWMLFGWLDGARWTAAGRSVANPIRPVGVQPAEFRVSVLVHCRPE